MRKYLFFIRHGQSEGNIRGLKERIILGRGDDSSLNFIGKKQIERLGKKIALKINSRNQIEIFSSPLKRTKESAKIINQYLKLKNINYDQRLLDINFGDLEGKRWEEISKKYHHWYQQFKKNRFKTPFPGGESLSQVRQRLLEFYQVKILPIKKRYIFIITHEGVIRIFLSLFDKRFLDHQFYSIANASLNSVYLTDRLTFVYQINSDELFFLKDQKSFLNLCNWYLKKEKNYFYFKPKKSFSDNQVIEVKEKDKKFIIKYIPLNFIEDYKKERDIFKKIDKVLPIPRIVQEEEIKDGMFLIREFIEGKIGRQYFQNKKHRKMLIIIWVDLLKKIHQLKLDFLKKENWDKFIDSWVHEDLSVLKKIKNSYYEKAKKFFETNKKIVQTRKLVFLHNDLSFDNFSVVDQKKNLKINGVWDFERSFYGDEYWDLAVILKICFYPRYIKDFLLFFNLYNDKNKKTIFLKNVNFYLLMNIIGAIRYRFFLKRSITKELKNLDYFFRFYLSYINKFC